MDTATIKPAIDVIKVPERVVYQRCNRFLKARGERLRKSRGYMKSRVGAWYCWNDQSQVISGVYLDLEQVSRVLGLLAANEVIDSNEEIDVH